MKTSRAVLPSLSILILVTCSASAETVFAQTRPRPSRPVLPPPRTARPPSEPGIQERSLILQELEKDAKRPRPMSSIGLEMAQIRNDYEKIQVVNNRMMSAVVSSPTVDYEMVGDATSEIKKRAERLRSNLVLPKLENRDNVLAVYEPPRDDKELKAVLHRLDRSLMSFIRSRLFANTDVVDADIAVKASEDLEHVIALSRRINKDTEKLRKGSR